ncbi:MAG: Werner helicase interacting protein 1 [Lichina confinis]|nr:MAG: Werner helicase interacting protein 1 [Lichina confinis]
MVSCPICGQPVKEANINRHIDSQCQTDVEKAAAHGGNPPVAGSSTATRSPAMSSFFQPSSVRAQAPVRSDAPDASKSPATHRTPVRPRPSSPLGSGAGRRQPKDDGAQQPAHGNTADVHMGNTSFSTEDGPVAGAASERRPDAAPPPKRLKTSEAFQQAAPLADRMRPQTLDEIYGQELVGPFGVLRGLIEQDRVPSMILWGGPGTGKTTIARVIANVVGSRVVEINSTSSGVADCKKIFGEARAELGLTGRKTIIFCDEIHRFSKTQQDVFLGPVESGHVTLIGATTENPSFKVQSALLSRCRTFVLQKLSEEDVVRILERALARDGQRYAPSALVDGELVRYLGAFADGDARTALNLLELAMGLSTRAGMTAAGLRRALTQTFVYDRGGDQHYDSISAFHKAIRGGDANAALYYLGRMLESGEDGLYIARRLVVVASEDVGLADNSMLPLAVAAHAAVERVGLPEARINLAHAAVALAHAKKSTRVYRGLANVLAALKREPGLAGLPIPAHLRNAPTRLMKEVGHGKGYKYNPMYKDGKVAQETNTTKNNITVPTTKLMIKPETETKVKLETEITACTAMTKNSNTVTLTKRMIKPKLEPQTKVEITPETETAAMTRFIKPMKPTKLIFTKLNPQLNPPPRLTTKRTTSTNPQPTKLL